jgi:hypothetical protein
VIDYPKTATDPYRPLIPEARTIVFKKQGPNLEEMSAEEMQAFHSKTLKRILWLNGLWLLFVVFMLFWKTGIGVVLLIITAVKYFFDYRDTESQAIAANFETEMAKKELREISKHDRI